ncbi:MAG: hypothetical protein ACTSVV_17420 [Promethearchaeota archaeon]
MTDEELEEELQKAFKENEGKKDQCGEAIPPNREIGMQRSNIKLKDE